MAKTTVAEQTEETVEQPAEQMPEPIADAPAAPSNWDALQGYNQNAGVDMFDQAAAGSNALPDDFEIAVDVTNVEQRHYLPKGTYHGRCIGIKPGKPSSKGDSCWIWTLQATEGPNAGGTIDNYTYTGPGVFRFAEVKRALGFEDREAINPGLVRNRACTFVVEDRINPNSGQLRAQVAAVVPPQKAPMGSIVEYNPDSDESIPF